MMSPDKEKQALIYMRWREEAVKAIQSALDAHDPGRAKMLSDMMALRDQDWVQRGINPATGQVEGAAVISTFTDFLAAYEINVRTVLVPRENWPYQKQFIISRKAGDELFHFAFRDFGISQTPVETPEDVFANLQHFNRLIAAGEAPFRRAHAAQGDMWARRVWTQMGVMVNDARQFMSYSMIRQFVHLRMAD